MEQRQSMLEGWVGKTVTEITALKMELAVEKVARNELERDYAILNF